MTHRVTGPVAQASKGSTVYPVALVFLDFQSEPVYVNSTNFTIRWNGHDWLGALGAGDIGEVEETIESKSGNLTLQLSGVDTKLLAHAIADRYQGRAGKLWVAFLDRAYTMIGDPLLIWDGPIDTMLVGISGGVGKITVTVNDGRAAWEQPQIMRYTNEDQQALFPGDKGFEFVPQMVEKQLTWGS